VAVARRETLSANEKYQTLSVALDPVSAEFLSTSTEGTMAARELVITCPTDCHTLARKNLVSKGCRATRATRCELDLTLLQILPSSLFGNHCLLGLSLDLAALLAERSLAGIACTSQRHDHLVYSEKRIIVCAEALTSASIHQGSKSANAPVKSPE
jgi:hypothetical protein